MKATVRPIAMVEMSTGSWSMALPDLPGVRRTGAGPCQNDDWVARSRYPNEVGRRPYSAGRRPYLAGKAATSADQIAAMGSGRATSAPQARRCGVPVGAGCSIAS